MKKVSWQIKCCLLTVLAVFGLNGCVYLVVGSLGALGGYVVSPDSVEGVVDARSSDVWETTNEILGTMGTISEMEQSLGQITAKVAGARVTIRIIPLSTTSSKIRVKARRAFFPKLSLAQEVYLKIMNRYLQ